MTKGLSRMRGDMAAYLLGQWAKTVPWILLETYGLAIWSRQLAHAPHLAGGLMLIGMLIHAALDLLIGSHVDRLTSARVRLLAVFGLVTGPPLLVLAMGAPHQVPLWASVLALLLLRLSYAAFDMPHNAWMTVLAQQAGGAGWLASARLLATFLATVTIAILGQALLTPGGPTMIWLAMVASLLWLLGCAPAAARVAVHLPISPRPKAPVSSGWRWLRDREVVLLLVLTAANVVLLAFAYASFAFLARERLADIRWAGWTAGAVAGGKIATLPAWEALRGNRWRAMGAGFGLCALGSSLLAINANPALFLLAGAVLGAGAGGINVMSWSLLPQLADRLDARHGEVSARLTASFTAITKAAAGGGALLLALTLPFEASRANIDPRFALVGIAFLMCLAATWTFARYVQVDKMQPAT